MNKNAVERIPSASKGFFGVRANRENLCDAIVLGFQVLFDLLHNRPLVHTGFCKGAHEPDDDTTIGGNSGQTHIASRQDQLAPDGIHDPVQRPVEVADKVSPVGIRLFKNFVHDPLL